MGSLSPTALQNVPNAKLLPKPELKPRPRPKPSVIKPQPNFKRAGDHSAANALAVTSQNVVVVLVSFADQTFKYDSASFKDLVFSDTFTNGFFKTSAYNNYQLAQAAESFGTANDGMVEVTLGINHPNNKDVPQSVIHAADAAADPFINYAAFDTNSDAILSAKELSIVFIAAGFENSFCGSDCAFGKVVWGHAFETDSVTHDGVSLSPYSMFGERHSIAVDNEHQATMGIIAQELGHLMLNLPDLYDSDQSSEGIGSWGLMGGGS